jgi:Siphovirus-type tail component, C-terminal domain
VITQMTLSDPARALTYVLIPSDAVKVGTFEVTAAVREVTVDAAGGDGSLDTTQWLSAAAVTLELTATSTVTTVLDMLGGFCVPWSRPWLVISDDTWTTARQIQLRFDSHAHPYADPSYRSVQLAWKAPRGLWEDTAVQSWTLAADVPDTFGLPVFADRGVASLAASGVAVMASASAGSSVLNVGGNARPHWVARLYGPASGPVLARDDTGQQFSFTPDLVVAAGDYLELDSAAQTVLLNSDPDASRLGFADFTASEWFPLDPGPCHLRYYSASGAGPGMSAVVTCVPVWFP